MPDIKTDTVVCEVRIASCVMHVELDETLVAYKLGQGPLEDQQIPPQLRAKLDLGVREGIATAKSLRAFLKGKAPDIKNSEFELVHPDLLAAMQREGYLGGFEALEKTKKEPLSRTPFTDFTVNGASVDNLVKLDHGNYMAFDRHGNSLPVAMLFEYIHARIVDGCYDLEKAAEILRKDPRVRFIPGDRLDEKGIIQPVPYYNSRSGSSRHIPFWFMPSVEDAKRLWEKQKAMGGQYPSTRSFEAVFELDMLGLRAGGAALYDKFYKTTEYAESTDD